MSGFGRSGWTAEWDAHVARLAYLAWLETRAEQMQRAIEQLTGAAKAARLLGISAEEAARRLHKAGALLNRGSRPFTPRPPTT